MSAPLWQAGHLYLPGDIVQPITAPATTAVAITNPGFETGTDAGWTLGPATTVSTADKFTGTYSIQFSGTGGLTDTLQDTASAVQPGQSITARMMYQQGAASAGHNGGRVLLAFYTSGMVLIGTPSLGNVVDSGSGGAWGQSTVTATAPATAAFVKLGVRVNRTNSNPSWADDFSWNHVAQAPAGLVFKAVQANAGTSGTSEPAWPNTVGLTVVDNQVTWEAIAATRVEWTASPILVSGASEPTWPTQIGEFVADGSIKWEAFSRRVEDENCPNTKVVAIVGSKVFAADRDVARFCATANPLDWTTERDAGYLPMGLQQANANDFNSGVFNQYRGNLVAFNASSFQNWQADPDPAAMALLDQMDGIGSTWQQAAQPVANDLFYLAALGVRTVGIAGGSTNLQAGDVGMPIDPLVRDAMRTAVTNGTAVRSTYYPSAGQYWLAFAEFPPPLPSITGNVPDGIVGASVNGSYVVSGGMPPYGPITVLSGTFPPGLTLNPDGSYSGSFTTIGSYSWTVGGVDAMGVPFSTPDSAVVAAQVWFSSSTSGVVKSIDGEDWLAAPAVDAGFSIFSGGGKVVNVRYAAGISVGETSSDEGDTWVPHVGLTGDSCHQGCYTGTHYLICANGRTIFRATDAVNYSTVLVPSGTLNSNLDAIACSGGTVLVAGAEDFNGKNVATSTDHGATFAASSMAFVSGGTGTRDVHDLATDGDRFVAVGTNNSMAYTDNQGGSWTQIVSPFAGTGTVRVVAWGLIDGVGRWIAANAAGEIAYSDDAETWVLSADTFGALPYNADGGGNRFILVGDAVMKAGNGVTWAALAHNQTGTINGVTPLRN